MGFDRKYGKVSTENTVIPDDEPVFLLRAQDAFAPYVIQIYADLRRSAGDESAAQDVERTINLMRGWHTKKLPD